MAEAEAEAEATSSTSPEVGADAGAERGRPRRRFLFFFFLAFGWLKNLLLLKNLLNCANSPENSEAARMFSENKREYNRRVREIVEQKTSESISIQYHFTSEENCCIFVSAFIKMKKKRNAEWHLIHFKIINIISWTAYINIIPEKQINKQGELH